MKKVLPVLITIILIGVAGWGVYLLATKNGSGDKTDDTDQTDEDAEDEDTDDADEEEDYSDITTFLECEAAGFPVQESYPARCSTPDGRTFTQIIEDDDTGDDDTVPSDTAYTLSLLTADVGAGSGEYAVTVKVTTAGEAASYAQGYTYTWMVDTHSAISNTRTSVTTGEYTHDATLHTTRSNPTIKFALTDPYSGKTVEISALLQDLLAE